MARRPGSNIITLPDLREKIHIFRDRRHAGDVLADMLPAMSPEEAILLGIPAGGVPVGIAIAEKSHLPFDIAVVSKITLPWSTETGYGAVAFDGTIRLNRDLLNRLDLDEVQIEAGISGTKSKVDRRSRDLRGGRRFPDLANKTAILIDDGLASGFTLLTAIDALKQRGADRIYVGVPTAHAESLARVAGQVDRVYCANIRSGFQFAVADAYADWYDISESELKEMLAETAGG